PRLWVVMLLVWPLAGCVRGPLSILQPDSPASGSIALIGWIMFVGALVLWVLVVVLALYATLHQQRSKAPTRLLLVGGGLCLPIVVLALLLAYGVRTGNALLPGPMTPPPYKVEIQ